MNIFGAPSESDSFVIVGSDVVCYPSQVDTPL